MTRDTLSEVAEKEFPRYGYRVIRVVRTVGICDWMLARQVDLDRLVELEVYDRALTNPMILAGYINRCPTAGTNDSELTRFPIGQIETDRLFAMVRPWRQGEPLHQQLVRPGRLPEARVRQIIISAGTGLRRILRDSDADVVALATNFFLQDDGNVVLDAPTIGPWVATSEAPATMAGLIVADTEGRRQRAQQLLLGLFIRLTTGRVAPTAEQLRTLLEARMLSPAELERVEDYLANPRNLYWLDEHLVVTRRRIPWWWLITAAAGIAVGTFAFRQHRLLAGRHWTGEIGSAAAASGPDSPADNSTAPPPDENRDGYVPYRLAEARREAKAGAFDAAFAIMDGLDAKTDLDGEERLAAVQTRTAIEAAMAAALTEMMDRARAMYENSDEDGALRLLDLIIETFPGTGQTREAVDFSRAIQAVRKERIRRQLDGNLAGLQFAQLRRKTIGEILGLSYPVGDRRYRGRLRLAKERLAGAPEVPMLDLLDAAAQAEERLFNQLLMAGSGARREALAAACTPPWAGDRPIRISEIRAGGIVEFRPEGLGFASWENVSNVQLLAFFEAGRGIIAADNHDYTFDLFLFCIRRRLAAAESYRQRLAGTRQQDAAAPFAGLWERLQEAAADKGE